MPKWENEVRQVFFADFSCFNCLNNIWPDFLYKSKTAFSSIITFMIHVPTKHTHREIARNES